MMDTPRDAFRQHLARGDLEGALAVVESHLPGMPGSSTRHNNLSGARAVLRWAQHEWRSVLHPDAAFGAAYLAHLHAKHPGQGASVQNRLTHARNLFRAMRVAEVCDANPFEKLRGPNHRAQEHRAGYSDAEVTRLCAHADAEGRALILLGAHGGLTGPEVLRLRWRDVNFERSALTLPDRAVPLSPELRAALMALASRRNVGELFPSEDRVFEIEDQREVRGRLFALCQAANVWYGERAWRALRAHAGRRWWRKHGDLARVAALLGLRGQRAPFIVRSFALRDGAGASGE